MPFCDKLFRTNLCGFNDKNTHKKGSPNVVAKISTLTCSRPKKNATTLCTIDNIIKVMNIIGIFFGLTILMFILRLKWDNIDAKLIILRNITKTIENPN